MSTMLGAPFGAGEGLGGGVGVGGVGVGGVGVGGGGVGGVGVGGTGESPLIPQVAKALDCCEACSDVL